MMDLPLNLHTIFKRNELWARRQVVSCMDDNTVHRYTYAGACLAPLNCGTPPLRQAYFAAIDFQVRVRRLATVLLSLGVKKGDRIATLAYNHYQHLELYFAIRTCIPMRSSQSCSAAGRDLAYHQLSPLS